MNLIRKLLLTVSYITCIPLSSYFKKRSKSENFDTEQLNSSQIENEYGGLTVFLPSVGLLIGSVLLALASLLTNLALSNYISAFILCLVWIILTGAIHLDGLMDSADGIFSHRSSEKMLEIMRDSRVGNFGAISGCLVIIGKIFGLFSLLSFSNFYANLYVYIALLLIPSWARWSEVVAIVCFPYARKEGMGKIWHDSSSRRDIVVSAIPPLLITLLIVYLTKNFVYVLLLPSVALSGILASIVINKILGGQTGDTYGAAVEISELSGLLFFPLFL